MMGYPALVWCPTLAGASAILEALGLILGLSKTSRLCERMVGRRAQGVYHLCR